MLKNGLIKRLSLIPKFMTSKTGKRIMTIHILPNILRSKDNQALRFGQLVEYNMFFKNHAEKGGVTLISLKKCYKR